MNNHEYSTKFVLYIGPSFGTYKSYFMKKPDSEYFVTISCKYVFYTVYIYKYEFGFGFVV
jgi:hypothetical protein